MNFSDKNSLKKSFLPPALALHETNSLLSSSTHRLERYSITINADF